MFLFFWKAMLTRYKLKHFPFHSWKCDRKCWVLSRDNCGLWCLLRLNVLTQPQETLEMQRTCPVITLYFSESFFSLVDGVSFQVTLLAVTPRDSLSKQYLLVTSTLGLSLLLWIVFCTILLSLHCIYINSPISHSFQCPNLVKASIITCPGFAIAIFKTVPTTSNPYYNPPVDSQFPGHTG